jgi:O-acetyl-ADP-ribose deacetylase (regulator of RNase III)
MEIRYVVGDATRPQGGGPRVIVHVCNDAGKWGRGFVLALSRQWAEPERRYRAWYRGEERLPFELGQVQFVLVEEALWVANLIGQHSVRTAGGRPPVRYEAIRAGLKQVATWAHEQQASVHMPRIGAGLAGGSWEEISPIVSDELTSQGIVVTVYDLCPDRPCA